MHQPAPIPENDEARLQALQECRILDTEAEPTFDALTKAATELCRVPIALISLVDRDRQWFKARVGIDATHTHRDLAFCGHAILTPDPLIVEDAREDPRFCESPLVLGPPHIRFYAGVPLELSSGERVGTLCVIDQTPHTLSDDQRSGLKVLAIQATAMLELRRKVLQLEQTTEELKQARTEADAANQAKSDFLASMSHEIRTPLNGIIGMTELLVGSDDLTPDQRRYVQTCRASGEALLSLINNVLDLSKIETGKLELDHDGFNLKQLIDQTVAMLLPQAQSAAIALTIQIDPAADRPFLGDACRIRQVLINLISNALKFTENSGPDASVVVACEHLSRTRFRINVTDTGIGIPEAKCEHIFDSFTQADATTTRRFGGTGLGLAISKRIVELMQGQIGVESQESKGSTFWFTLDLQPAESDAAVPTDFSEDSACCSKKQKPGQSLPGVVLLAEDHPTNRLYVCELLRRSGNEVRTVENGREAIEMLQAIEPGQPPIDLILMDCQMPELDGFDATRAIRQSEAAGELEGKFAGPIIALTANAIKGDRDRCLEAGMDDYLSKPVDAAALIAMVQKHLGVNESNGPGKSSEPLDSGLPMDTDAALARCMGDAGFLAKTLDSFVAETPKYVLNLVRQIEAGDIEAAARSSHAIKGAAGMVSAKALHQIADELETLGQDGKLADAAAQLDRLRQETDRCIDYIRQTQQNTQPIATIETRK